MCTQNHNPKCKFVGWATLTPDKMEWNTSSFTYEGEVFGLAMHIGNIGTSLGHFREMAERCLNPDDMPHGTNCAHKMMT
jgi:hypothetical protein